MLVHIADHGGTIVWDQIYYFGLSDYPTISDWELKKLILFIAHEKAQGRETTIRCDCEALNKAVTHALENPTQFLSAPKPKKITACTACRQKGCLTDFVCHTASIEDAKAILQCGKLLSAVKARGKTGIALAQEPRNAAKDPPDFFDYIFFSWGNCIAGDRLVMERLLGNKSPTEYDLSDGFKPGVRFYFTYESLASHEAFLDDGYTPAKVKHELVLAEHLFCCIVPEEHKAAFASGVSPALAGKVFYIKNDCEDIWGWSEKVYDFVCAHKRK